MVDILSAGKEVFALVAPDQRIRGPVSFELDDIRQRLRAAGVPSGSLQALRHLEDMTPNMFSTGPSSRFVYETIKRWSPACIDCKVDLRTDKLYTKPSHYNGKYIQDMISNPWSLCEVSCAACNDT